ncbi:MAG: type II toxin-antitoxin system PemK/MazF family toxin [Candidatus Pacebacteria bacterium]|nr:type II toxin-antitoxin system PemK/MazF family toxin [Candidatus Paceibacterota bacterium]
MKDFDSWNEIKKKTESENPRLYNVREIWWCKFGLNIGTEQDGKDKLYLRPCVILKSFGKSSCLVVPTTTSPKDHPFRINIGKIEGKEDKANISQIKTIDPRRLIEKIGILDKAEFSKLRKAVRNLF